MLFDSVYRKDENYYLKVFSETFIHNFFRRNIRNVGFWDFGSSSSNIRKLHFLKYKEFFLEFPFAEI